MAWQSIIVGVDGTPESLRAAELAQRIASAARAALVPVHAVPLIPVFTGMVGMEPVSAYSPELQDEVTRSSTTQISQALEPILPPATRARLEVQTGPAPFVLAAVARERAADLVVLGGKHHGALARGLGRSTAHYLVRTLDAPLLVVGESAATVTRVLAAVDLSAGAHATVQAAREVARLFTAELRLLFVVEPVQVAAMARAQWDERAYERRSRELFEAFVAPYSDVAPQDRQVARGVPAETIAAHARAWGADIVVVGSHGKGWVDRLLVGSTTEHLVAELPTSILVVPVKDTARRAAESPRSQALKLVGARERRARRGRRGRGGAGRPGAPSLGGTS